ncbi:MAG TPA: NAD(P)/FAD-dependent oxidoreductase [Armatimonadaceae bacterium]|nr:NAD(P)/FAD-dependent oxidoreductase [Armatimonadaceae bacterium]
MQTYDAVIVGCGPNALVAAAYLTKAGWSVAILDRNDRPGGGLRTDELIRPGFTHDTYAGFLILFALSRAYADFAQDLGARGLQLANSGTPAGVSLPDGRATLITTDVEKNVAEIERLSAGDSAGWGAMLGGLGAVAPQVFELLASDLTSPRAKELMDGLMVGPDGLPTPFAKSFLLTARDVLDANFKGDVWKAFLAPWVLHSGHGPDDANSGFWTSIFGLGLQMAGLPVGVGGAEMQAVSLAKLITDQGGTILPNTTASKILVEGGKAVGVLTEGGEEIRASRAVLATVNPDQLYGKLLAGVPDIPANLVQEAKGYRYGHGVFFVHLALSEPPKWHDERLNAVTYTHVCDGLDGVAKNYLETSAGLLPSDPVVGVGVPSLLDPSRAPAGGAVVALQQLDCPFHLRADGRGEVNVGDGTWTEDMKERYADRVIDTVASRIPNLKQSILGRYVISPKDLQERNLNWNQGDPFSGSHAISQSFTLRPLPGQNGHRTPVPGLYQIGAATHPGLGLAGASGLIVSQMLLNGG